MQPVIITSAIVGTEVIITSAIVGAEVTKAQQPFLPITPEEIIQSAVGCYEAGAAIIHIHVHDAEGNAT
jgi:3-keto-5-aminohexanoate cleavage enzyme